MNNETASQFRCFLLKPNKTKQPNFLPILCSCCGSLSEQTREMEKETDFRSLPGYSHGLVAKDQNPSKY